MFVQISLGFYVHDLPFGMERLRWVSHHKSLGISILALFLLRLGWRTLDRAPPLPAIMPAAERYLAHGTHWLIYGLAITAVVFGWLHASASGLGVSFFGWFPIPSLMGKDVELSGLFQVIHRVLVWVLAALLALHVGAAALHLWRGDGIVRRMLPRRSRHLGDP